MSVVIYAFRSPGSGAVYIGKHECDPTGWPRRGTGRLPDGYPGRGKVVERFHRKHGAAVQWRILAIVPFADWVRAERRAIHLARLIFGQRCVNILSGGDGLTSEEARAVTRAAWSDPVYAAKISAAAKAQWSDPESAAKISAAIKVVSNRPDVKAKVSAANREISNRPEVRARNIAANKAFAQTPERRAHLASIQASARSPEARAKAAATRARNKALRAMEKQQ